MDDIVPEKDRNPQTRLLHSLFLHDVPEYGIIPEVDKRAYFSRNITDRLAKIVLNRVASDSVLIQLKKLFFEGHPAKKVFDTFFNGLGRILIHKSIRLAGYRKHGKYGKC